MHSYSKSNTIQNENAKLGTSDWQLENPATGREIEGYASLTSVNVGCRISFFVSTSDRAYDIDIFRTGWYEGKGARLYKTITSLPGERQRTPEPTTQSGLIECAWERPYTLQIPLDWTSGVFLARLTASFSKKQSYIIFVVRDDQRAAAFLFQSSVTTFQAYNFWPNGPQGKSLYDWAPGGRAFQVSFDRPYGIGYSYSDRSPGAAAGIGAGEYLTNLQPGPLQGYPISCAGWEYNMVRWLERNGYDVTYCTSIDLHTKPSTLAACRAFLSVGHDEYWTLQMRSNLEHAIASGIHIGFFSANTMYWQIRLGPSLNGEPNRTMICYKSDANLESQIMAEPHLATVRWRDAPVLRPEAALIGVQYLIDPVCGDVVLADVPDWFVAGTQLKTGSRLAGLLGYEVDAFIPGQSPANAQILGRSPVLIPPGFRKRDATFGQNQLFSHMTFYRTGQACVFASGTIQWSWGLDDFNAPGIRPIVSGSGADVLTRNVLAKFLGY